MKKLLVLLSLAVTVVFISSCSSEGQSVEKGILGTWINNEDTNEKWVFSADGKMIRGDEVGKYGVTDKMLSVTDSRGNRFDVWNASISADGKTLILVGYKSAWWLTKEKP